MFSAGLNLLEMYGQERQDLLQYWARVQRMFLTLYGTKLITVACVTVRRRLYAGPASQYLRGPFYAGPASQYLRGPFYAEPLSDGALLAQRLRELRRDARSEIGITKVCGIVFVKNNISFELRLCGFGLLRHIAKI